MQSSSMNSESSLAFRAPVITHFARGKLQRALHWYDYAEMWLPSTLGKVLDYGCGTGEFLSRLMARGANCWGTDVDEEKLKEVSRRFPEIATAKPTPEGKLPFANGFFDLVVILEVIEHVSDERRVLLELDRVLAPGGYLLLTTPHRGLLTFLDPGNFKFLAPRIHRWIHCKILREEKYYDARFGNARRTEGGMIADFMTDQNPWHRHYRYEQIRRLTPAGLKTVGWAVYFPAFRALWLLRLALKVLSRGRMQTLPFPLDRLYRRLSQMQTRLGDQLVVLFRKDDGKS